MPDPDRRYFSPEIECMPRAEIERVREERLLGDLLPWAYQRSALIREALQWLWQREELPRDRMHFADWDRAAAVVCDEAAGVDLPGKVRVRRIGRVVQIGR